MNCAKSSPQDVTTFNSTSRCGRSLPKTSDWSAAILNELIDVDSRRVRVALHVCGGNPRRKRIYFTKYTDLVAGFRIVTSMKCCSSIARSATTSWTCGRLWDFKGELALGVIDQRSDVIETPEVIRQRVQPALECFPAERLLLTSECGFGHVPLEITRQKLRVLSETCASSAAHSLRRPGSRCPRF